MQEPTAPHAEATSTTVWRQDGHTVTLDDGMPPALSPSVALLPHDLFTPRRACPFGLDNAATSLARAICPNTKTYVE